MSGNQWSRPGVWSGVLQGDSIWNVKHTTDPQLQPLLDKVQTLEGAAADENFKAINKFVVDQIQGGEIDQATDVSSYFAITSADISPKQTDQFHLIPNLRDFR